MPRILISIILISIALTLGYFIVWPRYQEFQNLRLQIGEKEIELRQKEEYFQDLKKIAEDLKKYEKSLQNIDSALPPAPDLPALFNFLQNLASQTGLIVKTISVGTVGPLEVTQTSPRETPETILEETPAITPEVPKIPQKEILAIKKIPISLSLSGSYSSLKEFLTKLEQNSRLFEVKTISFSSPEKEKIFEFELSIETYSY